MFSFKNDIISKTILADNLILYQSMWLAEVFYFKQQKMILNEIALMSITKCTFINIV
jgi:hypothetical protein